MSWLKLGLITSSHLACCLCSGAYPQLGLRPFLRFYFPSALGFHPLTSIFIARLLSLIRSFFRTFRGGLDGLESGGPGLAMLCGGGGDEDGGRGDQGGDACRRGGVTMKRRSILGLEAGPSSLGTELPLPEKQPLGENGRLLIIKIATACEEIKNPSSTSSTSYLVHSVLQALVCGQHSLLPGPSENSEGTLESLRQSCQVAEKLEASAGLVHILALMRYRIQIERMLSNLMPTGNDVLRATFPNITSTELRLEQRRIRIGSVYCLLGGAGTFYLLVVIACASFKTIIKGTSNSEILRLANNIRCPDSNSIIGDKIIKDIIPAISQLREKYSFLLPFVYNGDSVLSSDIRKSDQFFDSISFNSFIKPRHDTIWASCFLNTINPSSSSIIPLPLLHPDWNQKPAAHVTIIQTQYDSLREENLTFPGPKKGSKSFTEEKLFEFTEAQRQFASRAKVPKDIDELEILN
ncbi:hypothetical protein BYT27DRAFT_7219711 [Phlegmacium glaucopus]|nr:hypothetical protein BYT27DRAFT_7219711 [Phlegmacium glaucopus]